MLSVGGGKLKSGSVVDIAVIPSSVIGLAVIEDSYKWLVLREVAPRWTAEGIREITEKRSIMAPDLKEMELV